MIIEIILFVCLASYLFYKWSTSNHEYFRSRNIAHKMPFLCFGNYFNIIRKRKSIIDLGKRIHQMFPNEKMYGIFELRKPIFSVRDPEIIKLITVKDFEHFMNHRTVVDGQDDVLIGNSLFNMCDQRWKDMRSTLTPAFTGTKMRLMFGFLKECCDDSLNYLIEQSDRSPNGLVIEMKDLLTRIANDVIATSAFGIKVDSLKDKQNEFFTMGSKVTNFGKWFMLKFFFFLNFKSIARFLKIQIINPEQANYFRRLVLDAIKYREQNNIIRPDMINMLMEAKKSPEKSHDREWTDDEIVAQCFLFFSAGFENSANTVCFAAHELMENPDVQEKLLREVDEIKAQLNGEPIGYDTLKHMKYLDMVVSETLRKWPGLLFADRVCTKPYVMEFDDTSFEVQVGDVFTINIVGLHYDPKYFASPETFDPERFSDANRDAINPYTYLPFGVGPRNCIAKRFAMMECKAILFYILSKFRFEASEKTSIPLVLEQNSVQLKSKNGFWLKLTPRC